MEVREQFGKSLVDVEPDIPRGPDDTKGCIVDDELERHQEEKRTCVWRFLRISVMLYSGASSSLMALKLPVVKAA